MSLVLHVDGERWRAHLRSTAEDRPGLVPVIKGNGYGFGNDRLARKAAWLGVGAVAVGTYGEVDDVASRFDGDIVVLNPWRSFEAPEEGNDRIVHTVGRLEDLAALLARPDRPRVVLERMTSMKRHGFTARGLREATALIAAHHGGPGVRVEGASLHLPLGTGGLEEADALLTDVVAAGLARPDDRGPATVWVSHLGPAALATLVHRYPDVAFRQRVGTDLWLGDRGALRVTAHVLDVHPVERGELYGYRGRTASRTGTIVVVSGGTAHGIGLEAPTGDPGLRSRASTLARGGLDAVGLAKSPYTIGGKARYFAEPPHMQSSMLFLPSGADVPAIGDEVDVRVRFTATAFDSVEIG
ncbi:alanine racemase [Marmoricola sp. RAF53]|uniref:alanine racemase n=1 Tax=Marmoricola sp. RAF53 TaxID=3233059 RepID=UPI003F985F55